MNTNHFSDFFTVQHSSGINQSPSTPIQTVNQNPGLWTCEYHHAWRRFYSINLNK